MLSKSTLSNLRPKILFSCNKLSTSTVIFFLFLFLIAKLTKVLKKVGKRTGIGKAVAAATVVAGAYEAGKRKLFTKDKKKVDKKSIGGETVVMKSGGGYIDDLL